MENVIDVTYGRKNENSVDNAKAMDFIKQTLKNRGYKIPEDILDDMDENGATGDLFSTEDPSYPQLDYYRTFDEDKAIEIVREYINNMVLYPQYYDMLPDNIKSIEDFK